MLVHYSCDWCDFCFRAYWMHSITCCRRLHRASTSMPGIAASPRSPIWWPPTSRNQRGPIGHIRSAPDHQTAADHCIRLDLYPMYHRLKVSSIGSCYTRSPYKSAVVFENWLETTRPIRNLRSSSLGWVAGVQLHLEKSRPLERLLNSPRPSGFPHHL